MMAVDYSNWADLTRAVLYRPPMDNFFSSNFFKKEEITHTGLVIIEQDEVSKTGVARFVVKDQPAHILTKLGKGTRYLSVPEMKEKMIFSIGEFEQMKKLGGGLIEKESDDDRPSEWQKYVLRHTFILKDRAERRYEMMCAMALTQGKIDVTEEGVDYKADFGFVDGVHYIENSSTEQWDDAEANPIMEFRKMKLEISRRTGSSDIIIIMGREAAELYISHPTVMKYLQQLNYPVGTVKPFKDLTGIGGFVQHVLPDGTPIYEYSQTYVDSLGQTREMFDPKICMAVTLSGDYRKYKGVIHKFRKGSFDIEKGAVEYLAEIQQNEDRTAGYFQLHSKVMPAIINPDSILIKKVIAG